MFRDAAKRATKWSNGIMPRVDGPPLSWFEGTLASKSTQGWVDCIDTELSSGPATDAARIMALMERFRMAYVFDPANCAPRVHPDLLKSHAVQRVLLIDEPSRGPLQPRRKERTRQFKRMVATACRLHPDAEFWLARSAAHPSGRWLSLTTKCPEATKHMDERGSLSASLSHFDHVYTLSAPEGMQALLEGVPLHVFDTPYYAGWGLTHDHVRQPARRAPATLAALFEVVFTRLSRYLDPATKAVGSLDSLLPTIEAHRATVLRFADLRQVTGVRFQWWKRPFATPFLTAGNGRMRWVRTTGAVRCGEHAVFWGARSAAGLSPGTPVLRIEDGFLHSVGLGSDHLAPYSQIIDRRGLYFDPSNPSDLTVILNETEFGASELIRAEALRNEITRLGLTKYNLGRRKPTWHVPAGKCIVLVPGQVADDASIQLGTRGVTTAEELLREVRRQRPDAFVIYKPHPDVLSGNRRGLIEANALADVVEQDSDLISLIEVADEVHTLSSLSGFDALIRGKKVHTYGLPFYAGWGLTHDALVQPWRNRELSLDMLVAGALLRYPVYWHWRLRLFTSPEIIVRQLAGPAARPLKKIRDDRLRPTLKALRWSANGIRHIVWSCRQYGFTTPTRSRKIPSTSTYKQDSHKNSFDSESHTLE